MKPAGLHRLQKQVAEAEEGPLQLRRKREMQGTRAWGMGWTKARSCSIERAVLVLHPKGFYLEFLGGSQWNAHQLSRCVLSGLWSPVIGQHGGRESSVSTAGPDISHGVSQPGVAAFPDLELTPS